MKAYKELNQIAFMKGRVFTAKQDLFLYSYLKTLFKTLPFLFQKLKFIKKATFNPFILFLIFPVLHSPDLFSNPTDTQKQSINQNCQENEECKNKEVTSLFDNPEEKLKNAQEKEENIQLAQSGRCSISMPKISPVVFQSVEAPQIEPMHQQEYQRNPDNPNFISYDLVANKPAGVLIRLDKFFKRRDLNADFQIDLYIEGIKYSNCFHNPLSGEMRDGQQRECSGFRGRDFKDGKIYKFFPLPNFKKNQALTTKVVLFLRQNLRCRSEKTFYVNTKETGGLKLGFTRIYGGKSCVSYNSISSQTLQRFTNSKEVKWYIPVMFPIKYAISDVIKNNSGGSFIYGKCDNSPVVERLSSTKGLLADIDTLERLRRYRGYHKIFAVTSFNYFQFHGRDYNIAGFLTEPRWKYWRWWWFFGTRWFKSDFLGGSWNVVFIREYTLDKHRNRHDNLNAGIVAHEMAHTLGQGREYYEPKERCQTFRGSPDESCINYEIPISLDIWTEDGRRFWKFLENRYSIMNNIGSIEDKWIDRETYQKTFKILAEQGPVIPNTYELQGESIVQSEGSKYFKAVVSGFYNEKQDAFVVPKTEIYKTNLHTDNFPKEIKNKKLPFITFKLKEENKTLQEIKKPVFKMNLKIFYNDKPPTKKPFDFSHTIAVFKLPKDYEKRNLKIFVSNPKGNVIYSASVPEKVIGEETALIDKIR